MFRSSTPKRILERLGIQTSSSLSKFDRSVFLILKLITYFFGVYMACFFIQKLLEFIDHNLIANI